MSFFSRSRSKGHYPYQYHGGGHYKRPHGFGGILGKIFDALTGSKRHLQSYSNRHNTHYPNHHNAHYSNHHNTHYPNRYHRKSSWS